MNPKKTLCQVTDWVEGVELTVHSKGYCDILKDGRTEPKQESSEGHSPTVQRDLVTYIWLPGGPLLYSSTRHSTKLMRTFSLLNFTTASLLAYKSNGYLKV